MLTLCIVFLVGLYIAKIFFPKEFMMSIQNERIVKIGTYIDKHKWLYYICCGITAYITYYLYCSACCGRFIKKWQELLEILGLIVAVRLLSFANDNFATALEHTAFVFLPFLMKGEFKNVSISFTVHSFAQVLSLAIRDLPMYLHSANFITIIFMTAECYLWLSLCAIIFYKIKKGE